MVLLCILFTLIFLSDYPFKDKERYLVSLWYLFSHLLRPDAVCR